MKIKLDDKRYLNSDKYCYWITSEYTIENGNKAGSIVERRVSGYSPTLEGVINSYIDRHICSSDATTLKELDAEIKKLKKDLKKWKICLEAI